MDQGCWEEFFKLYIADVFKQRRLIAFDGEHVIGSLLLHEELCDASLCQQRIDGDQRALKLKRFKQRLNARDLVRLAVHIHLSEYDAFLVHNRREQMPRRALRLA